jgi:hypothetical protein
LKISLCEQLNPLQMAVQSINCLPFIKKKRIDSYVL